MPITSTQREILLKRATIGAVSVALTLILAKLFAWFYSGSVAIQATLLDSALDAAASLINYFAVRHSLKPADQEHRFGHGKIEALAGLGQSLFIMTSGIFIFKSAVHRFLEPQPIENSPYAIAVMVLSILLTLALVRYQRHVVSQTDSTAVSADAIHYQSDLLINASVLVSLIVSGPLGFLWVDSIIGAGIAIYVLACITKIIRSSLDILMDRELPQEIRHTIKQAVLSHSKVHGLHDLRTRSTGSNYFFQLHLELDERLTLHQAHDIAFEVEQRIKEHYPNADIIIHQDIRGDHH